MQTLIVTGTTCFITGAAAAACFFPVKERLQRRIDRLRPGLSDIRRDMYPTGPLEVKPGADEIPDTASPAAEPAQALIKELSKHG